MSAPEIYWIKWNSEEEFYSNYYIPRSKKIVRGYLRWVRREESFDDFWGEVHLRMIPKLRSIDPNNTGFYSFDVWFYYKVLDIIRSIFHQHHKPLKYKVRLEECLSLDEAMDVFGDHDNNLIDNYDLANNINHDEDRQNLWNNLIPSLVGHESARVLSLFYLQKLNYPEIGAIIGKSSKSVDQIRIKAIETIRFIAIEDEIIKNRLIKYMNHAA